MRVLKKFPSIDIVVLVIYIYFLVLCSCGTCLLVCVVHGLQFENCFRGGELRDFCFPVFRAVLLQWRTCLSIVCVPRDWHSSLVSTITIAVLETSASQGGIACSRDSS